MVVHVVAAERCRAAVPLQMRSEVGADVVGIVTVHCLPSGPVVTVEVLAVADASGQSPCADALAPPHRGQCRRCALPLVGIVSRVEAVGAERTQLVAGLKIEYARLVAVVGGAQVGIGVVEIGVVAIAVAASVRSRAHKAEPCRSDGARERPVGRSVGASRALEAEVARVQRCGGNVDRSGIGTDAGYVLDKLDRTDRFDVDRQRVGLMPRAGVGKVDSVEHDLSLVERASADGDVRLNGLAATFANIDRRDETQGRLHGLERPGGRDVAIEQRRLCHDTPHGRGFVARDHNLVDIEDLLLREAVGCLCRRRFSGKQDDRHGYGKHSDRHVASDAREGCIALAAPTLESRRILLMCLHHLV